MRLALAAIVVLLALPATASAARVNYRAVNGAPQTEFFDKGGLRLYGSCSPTSESTIVARSSFDNANLHYNAQRIGQPDDANAGYDIDFDKGQPNEVNFLADLGTDWEDGVAGQLIYARPGGTNVTIDFMAEEATIPDYLGGKNCVLIGSARKVGSGHPDRVNFRGGQQGPPSPATFFSRGGLSLRAGESTNCDPSISGVLDVEARTSTENSMLFTASQRADFNSNGTSAETNFDPGSDENVVHAGNDAHSSNHTVYTRPGGTNVSVDWAGEESFNLFGGTTSCEFVGSARVAKSGSANRVSFKGGAFPVIGEAFSGGGLDIQAGCGDGELGIQLVSRHENAVVRANVQRQSDHAYGENEDFDDGESVNLFGGVTTILDETPPDQSVGQIVYARPGGVNVTVDFLAQEENSLIGDPYGGTRSCAFVGTAEISRP